MAISRASALICALVGCGAPQRGPARTPITLTYLGVAGWQIDSGPTTILVDPYFSRPALDKPISPDDAAIAAHAPAHADAIVVGHSHVDHLLDAPSVAKRTGAQLIGSASTARFARASGLPADHIITVKGGEDLEFGAYSIRAIPSLHSELDHKHAFGGTIAADVKLPMTFEQFEEGGTFAYLIRIGGHEIVALDTANFIERELAGLRPDIAIIAPGARGEIHDYTCRLLRALGDPPLVYATHFDDWRGAAADIPPDADLRAFADEVTRCSPHTVLVIPKHFSAMVVP
ncbi:MAG TPA: MBL fold metallo-hydrolase [Kofleriaceae bacterium]|jgi:L-ascorbate metabolism protein UlaG (beta-lactamase superfamily)